MNRQLFLVLLFSLSLVSLAPWVLANELEDPCLGVKSSFPTCKSPLYCHGDLLRRVQQSQIFSDDKTFVDMPCRSDEATVLAAWDTEVPPNASKNQIKEFLERHFLPAGSDVEEVRPRDWPSRSPLLSKLRLPELREFVGSLHAKWLQLIRKWRPEASRCSSGLATPDPFVVAGGRFRESYYWDSYWILRGLLLSGMRESARNVITNMAYTFRTHGVIPNGQRVYYLNRSQPPLLPLMVRAYVDSAPAEDALKLLREILPDLRNEYLWWMDNRLISDSELMAGPSYLNVYNVTSDHPRPESYEKDLHTCREMTSRLRRLGRDPEASDAARDLFTALASGAESGWDFSSRFMEDPTELSSLRTQRVVPVDLNSILHLNELALASFYERSGDHAQAGQFRTRSTNRASQIKSYLWLPAEGRWGDRALSGSSVSGLHLSDLMPLLSGGHLTPELARKDPSVTADLRRLASRYGVLLNEENHGLPTSNQPQSLQQWDGDNVWAPINQWTIEALLAFPQETGFPKLAFLHARRLFQSMYCGWLHTRSGSGDLEDGSMYEKYNARRRGAPGGGGEYPVQTGFGWSNGVALWILDTFADRQTELLPGNC